MSLDYLIGTQKESSDPLAEKRSEYKWRARKEQHSTFGIPPAQSAQKLRKKSKMIKHTNLNFQKHALSFTQRSNSMHKRCYRVKESLQATGLL